MKLSDTVGTIMIMYENCDSGIVCGEYDKHLAICIVARAQHM